MTTDKGMEPKAMAKAQKTVMIPEDLYRMFAEQEKRTGVTFARQATAAFCAYFFTSRNGPDPLWIEAVVAHENGELSIADIPSHVAKAKSERARAVASQARKLAANDVYSPFDPEQLDQEAGRLEEDALAWKREGKRGEDPIQQFISYANHHQSWVARHLNPEGREVYD